MIIVETIEMTAKVAIVTMVVITKALAEQQSDSYLRKVAGIFVPVSRVMTTSARRKSALYVR